MATIHLVRHGQASFGSDNYDQLSPTGWQQGKILGHWLAEKVAPSAVVAGKMQRHRETVEAMASGYGTPLPALQTLDGLNEFDHVQVIQRYRPQWADKAVMKHELRSDPAPMKAFQHAFQEAVVRWVSGEHDHEYSETWQDFRQRVVAALTQLIEIADGGDVIVSTSGGPIAVIAQHLLDLSDRKTLEINSVIANTSVSRILYSGSRRSLAVFNNYSHLEAEYPDLVTFR